MQVLWSGHDRAQWDAWHRTAAAALQQDWAYGEAMQSGGVRCLRARVLAEVIANASLEERTDQGIIKEKLRVELRRFFRKRSGRRPFVLPVIMEI